MSGGAQALRNRRGPRRGRHVPHRGAGDGARPRRDRLAGGAAPAGPDRPRHARVGADAGGRAGRRRRRGRRRRAARRRAADPGGRDPGQAARARPRRGRLRLPQPLPRQRHQVLLRPAARSSTTSSRRGSRPLLDDAAHRAPGDRGRGGAGGARARTAASRTTCASCEAAFPLDLSGRRVVLDCANGADPPRRAGDLRAARRRGRDDRRRARRAQHQRRLRLDPPRAAGRAGRRLARPRSASPSTATATACWPSTAPAASTTATS